MIPSLWVTVFVSYVLLISISNIATLRSKLGISEDLKDPTICLLILAVIGSLLTPFLGIFRLYLLLVIIVLVIDIVICWKTEKAGRDFFGGHMRIITDTVCIAMSFLAIIIIWSQV